MHDTVTWDALVYVVRISVRYIVSMCVREIVENKKV